MAWIESHQSLGRHPKLLRLATELQISPAAAIGHLSYIWWWALDYAEDGDLSKYAAGEVSLAGHWLGEAVSFYEALKKCSWIDPDGKLHDWLHYAGPCLLGKERQKRYRNKRLGLSDSVTSDVTNDVTGTVTMTTTIPNHTIPNHTIPNHTIPIKDIGAPSAKQPRKTFVKPTPEEVTAYGRVIGFVVDGNHFCDFYESKGWLVGRAPMKNWQATLRGWKKRGGIGLGQNKFLPGVVGTKVGATGGFVTTKQPLF